MKSEWNCNKNHRRKEITLVHTCLICERCCRTSISLKSCFCGCHTRTSLILLTCATNASYCFYVWYTYTHTFLFYYYDLQLLFHSIRSHIYGDENAEERGSKKWQKMANIFTWLTWAAFAYYVAKITYSITTWAFCTFHASIDGLFSSLCWQKGS